MRKLNQCPRRVLWNERRREASHKTTIYQWWPRNDDLNRGRGDEKCDGAQADEEPLAGSRVRTGLVNVDIAPLRQSEVVSGASRRSLIENEAHRHSMLVM